MNRRIKEEVDEYFALGAIARPGDVVFDVGANIGAFADNVAARCHGDVNLYCFEPVPQIFDRLSARFSAQPLLRDTAHQLINAGLTHKANPRTIAFSYFHRFHTDSTYDIVAKRAQFLAAFRAAGSRADARTQTLLPGPVGRWFGRWLERLVSAMPRGRLGEIVTDWVTGRVEVECAVTTLSEVVREHQVDHIDLLKIDVEGAELDVIRGGDASTWDRVHQVVLEGHSSHGRLFETARFLRDRGLRIRQVVRPEDARRQGLDNYLLRATR